MNQRTEQLSFHVEPHPQSADRGEPWLDGEVKISGGLGVSRDLQPGDMLTISVANADGEVIATEVAEVHTPSFPPIKVKDVVVGTMRSHKAKIVTP